MIVQHINNDSWELDQWDQFLMSSSRGHYCQLSTYLKSFKAYGFNSHVIVVKDRGQDQIIGIDPAAGSLGLYGPLKKAL
jgi:hypothetical protein